MESSRRADESAWADDEKVGDFLARHRDLFDAVTGLPGPVLLIDRVEMTLARAARLRCFVGVFVLRSDYVAGNTPPSLAKLVADLRAELRNDDTLARIDGRTFVVVCGDLYRQGDADRIADRLLRHIGVNGAVGVALAEPSDTVPDVLQRAAGAVKEKQISTGPYPERTTGRFSA
jgi:GGDEF domain-containing protein